MIAPLPPTVTLKAAQQRIADLERLNQTLVTAVDAQAAELDRLREHLSEPRRTPPPSPDRVSDVVALLTSLRLEIHDLRRELEPLLAITARVRAREQTLEADDEAPQAHGQSRVKPSHWRCWLFGHLRSEADWCSDDAASRCGRCGVIGVF